MKKFFLVYGLLLMGLFAAFSYFESKTKDERILAAKLRHTFQLNKPGSCKAAFNLLSQRKHAALKELFENRDLEALKAKFCSVWGKEGVHDWSVTINRVENDDHDYQVLLKADSLNRERHLYFVKEKSVLALVEIN